MFTAGVCRSRVVVLLLISLRTSPQPVMNRDRHIVVNSGVSIYCELRGDTSIAIHFLTPG